MPAEHSQLAQRFVRASLVLKSCPMQKLNASVLFINIQKPASKINMRMLISLMLYVSGYLSCSCWSFGQTGEPAEKRPNLSVSSSRQESDPEFHRDLSCGPNSLYLMLRLNGISADPSVVSKFSQSQGMSLDELQKASTSLGLKTEVRRFSINEFRRSFDLPVIVHLWGDTQTQNTADDLGHYIVVIAANEETMTVVDGTTGEQRVWRIGQWLAKRWSGFVLVPSATNRSSSEFVLAVLSSGWILVITTILFRRRIL